jgi:predicted ATP-dependent serine protease
LLLQIAQDMAAAGRSVFYVSGEESPHQIKLRSTAGLFRKGNLSTIRNRRRRGGG